MADENASSKSSSRRLTPASVVIGRYVRPRWASPSATTFTRAPSVDQGADVGGRGGELGRRQRRGAQRVVVEMHPRRDRERRVQVGDEALARHQRLDLGTERAYVLLGRPPQHVAVLLVGEAEDEEGVELAQQLVVEELRLL